MAQISFSIDDSLLSHLKNGTSNEQKIKIMLAIELFKDKVVSLKDAAIFCELDDNKFSDLLIEKGISMLEF